MIALPFTNCHICDTNLRGIQKWLTNCIINTSHQILDFYWMFFIFCSKTKEELNSKNASENQQTRIISRNSFVNGWELPFVFPGSFLSFRHHIKWRHYTSRRSIAPHRLGNFRCLDCVFSIMNVANKWMFPEIIKC